MERVDYDEFAYFADNCSEYGIPYDGPPTVRREFVTTDDGRRISALVWGTEPAEVVFVHGGAQNAHTWDTVILALGRPAVAVDLPGHGHSDGGRNGSLDVRTNAADVAAAIDALAPEARCVVGMSLGGLTTLALAGARPDLTPAVVLVDVTPGVNQEKSAHIHAFVNGPESFPSFEELLARTMEFNPTRSESSLRRGILHNAEQREDGSWVWRYARFRADEPTDFERVAPEVLWDVISEHEGRLLLARGMATGTVVDDDDEAELRRRRPDAEVEHFEQAGHSIQGDMPVELAARLEAFLGG